MKKLLLLLLMVVGFSNQSFAQVFFTFDSIWAPPYICQAHVFDVEVFGMKSGANIQDGIQSFLVRSDTVYVQFHFVDGFGIGVSMPFNRKINIPAPGFGVYKIVAQGIYNSQVHQTLTSRIGICSSISGRNESEAESLKLKIYPNPVQNYLLAELPVSNVSGSINLTDLSGRMLFTKKIQPNQRTVTLNMKQFPDGLYLLQYHSEGTSLIQKFLKQ